VSHLLVGICIANIAASMQYFLINHADRVYISGNKQNDAYIVFIYYKTLFRHIRTAKRTTKRTSQKRTKNLQNDIKWQIMQQSYSYGTNFERVNNLNT
jgi:hypothetical protein